MTQHQYELDRELPKACIALLLMVIFLLTGCATQSVEQTSETGVTTKYRAASIFSKTAMTGTVLGRETKTTKELFGQKNSQSEVQTEAIAAFFAGMQSLFEAGLKAGAKTAIPIP